MMIFTDGSFSNQPKMCGIGIIVLDGKKKYEFGAYTEKCKDNNIAEIYAIAYALKQISENRIFKENADKHLIIMTDSMYAVNKIKNNQLGRDELEQKALDYIQYTIKQSKKTVSLFQMKGHTNDNTKLGYYNNLADQLANDYRFHGLVKYQDQIFRMTLKKKEKRR